MAENTGKDIKKNCDCDKNAPDIHIIEKMPEFQKLNDSEKKIVRSFAMQVKKEEHFLGPIPHPDTLKGYVEINPEYGDRIFKMAETEANRRNDINNRLITISSRGQILAFILAILVVCSGIIAIYFKATVIGSTIFGTTIAALAATFFRSSIKK